MIKMTNQSVQEELRQFLLRDFQSLLSNKPKYSFRAFAKEHHIDPALMTKFLKGRRRLGLKTLSKIHLQLDASHPIKERLGFLLEQKTLGPTEILLVEESPLENWYDFPLWEISRNVKDKFKILKIAEQMGLSDAECDAYLNRMVKFGFLENPEPNLYKDPKKEWILIERKGTPQKKLFEINRYFHQLSLEAGAKFPTAKKESTGLSLLLDIDDVPYIQMELQKFRNRIKKITDRKRKKNSCYQMLISFFPLAIWN